MRVAIAGAGAVGRSVAQELIENGHQILLIDKDPRAIRSDAVPDAEWLLADACEMSTLDEAGLNRCDVMIAATGDDKANLVISLLAKTEFAVPRTVGRVNHPHNEWLFNESWGVDVLVSTPRLMSALVEEAVSVGDLVRLFTFRQSDANLTEIVLPADSPYVGHRVADISWPRDGALVAILRDGGINVPEGDRSVEAGDELLFVAAADREHELASMLSPAAHPSAGGDADAHAGDDRGVADEQDADGGRGDDGADEGVHDGANDRAGHRADENGADQDGSDRGGADQEGADQTYVGYDESEDDEE